LLASRALREVEVVGGLVETVVAGAARRHGLSHAALNALAVIEGNGGPLPAGEVGARMHITSGSATSLLDTLERKNYIVRVADPGDRRRVLVDITRDAQAVLDVLLPEVQQIASAIMGAIGDNGLQELLDLLALVRESIANLPSDLPAPAARRTPARLRRS
jgi:DNA-binding MarR family transcriptional regulator